MGPSRRTALGQLLVVIYCCVVLGSKIRLEDQGYVDIVVVVDRRVPEDPTLITNLQALLLDASTLLHRATREMVYLKRVTIVLPHTWKGAYPTVPGASEADINVVQSEHDQPSTVQPGGCGEPGLSIELPASFVLNLNGTTRENYKRPEYVMVHEWAHFRYGVFDEYGSPKDSDYPAVYQRNGKLLTSTCSADIRASLETENGNPCSLVEGVAAPDCVAFTPIDEFTEASSSLMFMPPLTSINAFCGDTEDHKHNADAPTPQNVLCDMRSTWDVISNTDDFRSITNPVPRMPTEFRIVKGQGHIRIVFVLDVSGSMGLENKINMLRQAASRSLEDNVPDGSDVGIITFSDNATVVAGMRTLSAATRQALKNAVPSIARGSTAIGKALMTSVQELERNGETAENAALLLMTDGEENEPPYINDVLPLLLQKRVRVFSVPVGKEADDGLRVLSERTGENVYPITNTTKLADRLAEMFAAVITTQQEKSERRETVFKRAVPLTSARTSMDVMVDEELGLNTMFIATGAPEDTTAMMAVSPTGREILAQYDYDLQRHKVVVPNHETGRWRVVLISHPINRVDDTVTVTVTSEARDPDVQPVRMRSFFSSRSLESVGSSTLFKIYAELRKENVPVVGAKVLATVTTPLGNQVHVPLKDRGDGADVRAEDGIYSAFFSGFNRPGRYSVDVEAAGDSKTRLGAPKMNSASSRQGWSREKRSVGIGDSPVTEFSRYENAGSFVVHKLQRAVVYPPASVRDLRVESASRAENGSRIVTISWTSPGAHLDQDVCSRLQVHAGTSPSSLLIVQGHNVHNVSESDVTEGTLVPTSPGSRQVVTFLLPTTWLPVNESAHDVYFILFTWNPEGLRSNRSNLATANFPDAQAVIQKDVPFWDWFSNSSTAMYGCTVLLALALGGVVCLLILSWLRTRRKGEYPVAVFRTAPMKGDVERACRVNLLSRT